MAQVENVSHCRLAVTSAFLILTLAIIADQRLVGWAGAVPGMLLGGAACQQECCNDQEYRRDFRGALHHFYSRNVYSSMTLPMASAHTVQNDSERVNIRQFCSDR